MIGKGEDPRGNGLEVPGLYTDKHLKRLTEKRHSLIKDYYQSKLRLFD